MIRDPSAELSRLRDMREMTLLAKFEVNFCASLFVGVSPYTFFATESYRLLAKLLLSIRESPSDRLLTLRDCFI